MERSQSCSTFDIANNNKNINYNNSNKTNNNKNNNNNNVNITKSYHKLRGCSTTTHQIHHQQQQQQQQQHFEQSGSSESLNIMTTTTTTTITSNVSSGSTTLPRYTARRRNKLERQKSTSITDIDDDEYQEDSAYHGDLEEEEEDDQTPDDRSEDRTVSRQLYQKHLQFAQNKTQSESMITIPTAPSERRLKHGDSFDSSVTANQCSPASQRRQRFAFLPRDNSVNSDSSRYSSVDSLLEARKPDPEAILINLGFGPVGSEDILSRIPKRFLKPSQVRGIDTDAFVKRLQLASNLADHSVLGYRGLTGNPDVPPSSIVAKIMQRFEVNQRKKSMGGIE